MRKLLVVWVLTVAGMGVGAADALAFNPDVLVSNGSPPTPFSQNKQNEPALAVDANHPNVLVAGANDEIDMEACNAGADNTCPFTPGVGVSGVYFSFDSGATWTQPTYTGLTARDCLGAVGTGRPGVHADTRARSARCRGTPRTVWSPTATPRWRSGPRPGARRFQLGQRLAAVLREPDLERRRDARRRRRSRASRRSPSRAPTTSRRRRRATKSRVDAAGARSRRQSSTTFSDKEQIWADNASSSPFFGTVYVCWASFRGQEKGNAAPGAAAGRGLARRRRHLEAAPDLGGRQQRPAQPARRLHHPHRQPRQRLRLRRRHRPSGREPGVRADVAVDQRRRRPGPGRPPVAGPVTQPGAFDPVQGRPVIDGVAGARSDLAPAPSVDIANGAPTGADATEPDRA